MKLSDFLLWPSDRVESKDGLELTVYDNNAENDPLVQEYLRMMGQSTTVKEAQMIMTLLYVDRRAKMTHFRG